MYSCFENKTEDGKESQIMYCRKLSILILYHFFLKIPIDCCCLGGGVVGLGCKVIYYIPIDDGMGQVLGRGGGI